MERASAQMDPVVEKVARRFVELVRTIPEVQQVLLMGSGAGCAQIWTVLSAPPFERKYRQPIYAAELDAMQVAPSPTVDWRLINVQELEDRPEDILPAEHLILFSQATG